MPTLKTTIVLESSDVLANSLKNSKTVTNTVNGGDATFQQNELPPSQTEILFDSDVAASQSGILYFYCEAASGNSTYGVDIAINNKSLGEAKFARLLGTDIMYVPVYGADEQGVTITATNNDPAASAVIKYFLGSKD